MRAFVLYGVVFGMVLGWGFTGSARAVLPEGNNGIAARHPHDTGIEQDSNVIFVEKFDESSLTTLFNRWEDRKETNTMSFSTDVPAGAGDTHSLLMTHTGGQGSGPHLYRRLLPGYDQVYARFYVKFDPACYSISHMGTGLGGYNPPTSWPQGGAGVCPSGSDRFSTHLEPFGSSWAWAFYTYWKDMRNSPPIPPGAYWGNTFTWGVPGRTVVKGRWICVEIMVKTNNPVSDSNGEQAWWIDGQLIRYGGQIVSWTGKGFPKGTWTWDKFSPSPSGQPFEGFQWRTVDQLRVNFLWTYIYITTAPSGYVSKVWFDNIVVAKEYIGPIVTQLMPVAEAGNDRAIYEAYGCTLDGSASTDANTYSWQQVGGKTVVLTGANTAKPSFTTPTVASVEEAQLRFRLTVTNSTGQDSDEVGVRVKLRCDANGDDRVDSADLAIWQEHYDPLGRNANTTETGDFNGDGKVDSADLGVWQREYNPAGLPGGSP